MKVTSYRTSKHIFISIFLASLERPTITQKLIYQLSEANNSERNVNHHCFSRMLQLQRNIPDKLIRVVKRFYGKSKDFIQNIRCVLQQITMHVC